MSQFLGSLFFKRSFSQTRRSSRLFSTSATCPYLILGSKVKETFEDGSKLSDLQLFDPAKEELVTVPDRKIPKEVIPPALIGSSHGWGFFYETHNGFFCMSDYLHPLASKSNPKLIQLPPQTTPLFGKSVGSVALSSSPSDQDCVVAIKYFGKQLSLYRPDRDLGWTKFELPSIRSMENSKLTYSEKDECFYLPASGGSFLCSLDLHFELKFRELLYRGLPEFSQSQWELLRSSSRAEHWVESSSGESFLVQWYSRSPLREPMCMVFSEEETMEGKYMCYTEDIGDACIFISDSHPFCVEASSCPGLEPNSIYMKSPDDFFVYNLATKTCRTFKTFVDGPMVLAFEPF